MKKMMEMKILSTIPHRTTAIPSKTMTTDMPKQQKISSKQEWTPKMTTTGQQE